MFGVLALGSRSTRRGWRRSLSAHHLHCKDRVEIEPGIFFDRVPSGCDAYMMKLILHDWSDQHCREILGCIRQVLPVLGRILICEQVLTDTASPIPSKFIDIEMLALTMSGKERMPAEFADLSPGGLCCYCRSSTVAQYCTSPKPTRIKQIPATPSRLAGI